MTTTTDTQRFAPQMAQAWGQMIAVALVTAILLPIIDAFKFPDQRSFLRLALVGAGGFVAVLVYFWFKSGRRGCHAIVLNETGLTVEDNAERTIIPWKELQEVVLITYGMGARLKFKSRNRRDYIRVESTGHSPEQWESIKKAIEARGFALKPGAPEP